MEKGHFARGKRLLHRSFLAFLYWFGVRKQEALNRVKEDFRIQGNSLYVHVPPLKHGKKRPDLSISVDAPYVDLIIKQVKRTRSGQSVWNLSPTTAWRIVSRVLPKHYPHFFRLNRCVNFLNTPGNTIAGVQSWFGWNRIETVNSYVELVEVQKMGSQLGKKGNS